MTTDYKNESKELDEIRMSTAVLEKSLAAELDGNMLTSALDVLSANVANLSDPQLIQHTTSNVYRAAILELGGDELR